MNVLNRTIIIVDDEKHVLSAIRRCLRDIDANIYYFSCPKKALDFARDNKPDVVLSDQRMPLISGVELLGEIKGKYPGVQNILLSAFNDFNEVANAFNNNLIDKYLSKPWDNKELQFLLKKSIFKDGECHVDMSSSKGNYPAFHGMISNNQKMGRTFDTIKRASTANIPVFITGATGTGKELAARACHLESCRSEEVFVAVNCANFSESLMESQLFGHNKGAFTGAVKSQQGLLAAAGEGTLFLDEITCLPLTLQAKLLRVIQEREFCSIGSNNPQAFQAQVISASSISLRQAVENNDFREDLFYRLDVISIELPKLSERGSDVLILANYFLTRLSISTGKIFTHFSDKAKELMLTYRWPGNIRQLENLLHSLVVLNDGPVVTEEMLRQGIPEDIDKVVSVNLEPVCEINSEEKVLPLWLAEKKTIESAISLYDGNVPRAAAALEVSPSTLYRKIQSWKSLNDLSL